MINIIDRILSIKQDDEQHQILNSHNSYRQINSSTLEPRHDLPLHKIPELLAKITLIVSSNTKQLSTSIDCYEQLFKHYSDNNH
ncbi:unnamed protein product [Rotaria sordida]|uniref:Uncharacterized protein n=1 Tax=Rotaria sordida TaxID=392033 RepID=A0A814Y0P8_9BILA|nr:unnamed protein product [Rotaria sordida]